MSKKVTLHFWNGDKRTGESVEVECRTTEAPRKGATQCGYGNALPTPYMVRLGKRWHRVRVACFSNAGTAYIGKPGNWLATVED